MIATSEAITAQFDTDAEKISSLGRAATRAARVHGILRKKALASVSEIVETLEITPPTARAALQDLKRLKIVSDIKGKGKERIYRYTEQPLLAFISR